ncbi:hypothetical protein M1145_00175 [Patescibacteria group bacterium]|nr:hypothetical protein [Patescibacteria group bacterium]
MKNDKKKTDEFNLDHRHGELGYIVMIAGLLIILSQFSVFHMLIDSRIFWGILLIVLGFIIVSKKYHH